MVILDLEICGLKDNNLYKLLFSIIIGVLKKMENKKGMLDGKIATLIGALIFIVIAVALMPTMFSGLNTTNGPSWLNTVLPIIVASGMVFAIYRAFK